MARGESIMRESDKPMRTLQKLINQHPTDMEVLQAQIQLPGQPFYADGHTYRIKRAELDAWKRLIAIGELES